MRLISPDEAEVKRMYVANVARGMGVGRALLRALEGEARELGARRLVLETGVRQPEAIGLYESAGLERIEAFGEYVGSEFSVCMRRSSSQTQRVALAARREK